MSKKKYSVILGVAWERYVDSHYIPGNPEGKLLSEQLMSVIPMRHNRESFEEEVLKNPNFAIQWGLEVDERKMTWEEQVQWVMKYTDVELENLYIVEEVAKPTTPTKIITVGYGDKTEIHMR